MKIILQMGLPSLTYWYRVMRLLILFMIFGLLHAYADVRSQTVSLHVKNTPLHEVLEAIEQQTGYVAFTNKALLRKAKRVSVDVENQSLSEVLSTIFQDQVLTYELGDKTIVIKEPPAPQPKPVRYVVGGVNESLQQQTSLTGTVVDTAGQPIQGATVSIIGASVQTQTDEYGRFSLRSAVEEGMLRVRFVGYQTLEVPFDSTIVESFRVVLIPTENLIEEVEVNTGYQTIPKERATGSFVHIDNELLNRRVTTNILERLDGIAPGLQFDNRSGSAVINIRGINTLNTIRMGPLIVVDNFPYEGDIENINPNDVASVTLLKDAAAASIWGARAANGVIVITMKQPDDSGKPNFTFTGNTSLIEKPDLYYHQRMTSADFIDVEMMLFEQGHYATQLNGTNSRSFVFSPVVDLLNRHANGSVSDEDVRSQISLYKQFDYRDDMMQHVYRTAINQQYAFSTSGRNKFSSYLISAGFDKNLNAMRARDRNRMNVRVTNTFNPLESLEIQTNILYTRSIVKSGGGNTYPINPSGGKSNLYPYARLIDEMGNALPIPVTYNMAYTDTAGNGQLLDWKYRPLDDFDHEIRMTNLHHVSLGSRLKYNIVDGVNLEMQYNFEKQHNLGNVLYQAESYHARNLINRFTQIDNGTVKRIIPNGDILQNSFTEMNSHRARGQVNFDRSFGDKHVAVVFLGTEFSNKEADSYNFQTYGYNDKTLTSSNMDFVNSYPIFDGLSRNSAIPNSLGFGGTISRFVSFYGNASYTYDRRFIISASARKDASNAFGARTNSRWNPLWSSGFSWVMSNEAFMKESPWIDMLKLRTTYGYSGNSGGGGNTKPLIVYNSSTASYTNLPFALIIDPPNPYLKWENVRMINYGIDFSLFQNVFSGSVEYFTKKSTDLISSDPIDPTTGFNVATRNVAEIQSKGVDIQVNFHKTNGPLKWQSSMAFSFARDVVTSFYGTISPTTFYVNSTGQFLTPLKDKVLYPVFSYKFGGLDPGNGNPWGYVNGEPSQDYYAILTDSLHNINYHGSGLPPYYGFFRNSFSWKRWDLSFNIMYKFGAYFQKETIDYTSLFNSWVSHKDFEKRWQRPGDELATTVPSMIYPAVASRDTYYRLSEVNVEKADLIRLQDIRLAYSMKPKLTRNAGRPINLQGYVNANHVGLIWSATNTGLDPDYTYLPPGRTISIGIKGTF